MKKTFKQHLAKQRPGPFLSLLVSSCRVNLILTRESYLIACISSYRVYLFGNRSTMLATVTAAKA